MQQRPCCSLMSKKGEFGISSWNTFFFDAPSLSSLWSTPFFHLQHNTFFSENIPALDPPIPLIPIIAWVFLSVCSINVKAFERGAYLPLHRRTFKSWNLKCHEDPLFHCLPFEVNGHPCQGTKGFDSIGTFPHRFKEYNFSFLFHFKVKLPSISSFFGLPLLQHYVPDFGHCLQDLGNRHNSFLFSPVFSFPLTPPNCAISMATFIFPF